MSARSVSGADLEQGGDAQSLGIIDVYPAQIRRIVQVARDLQIPTYQNPDAAATLFERRLKRDGGTPASAMGAAIRHIEAQRRSLNHEGERQATERFHKTNAERAKAADTERRIAERQAARMRRASRDPLYRLQAAIGRARHTGGVRALTPDPQGGGRSAESDRHGPPNAEAAAYERAQRIVIALCIGLEHELDTLQFGLIPEDEPARAARIVRDYEGIPSDAVPALDPTTRSGTVVRNARNRLGRDPKTGRRINREDT